MKKVLIIMLFLFQTSLSSIHADTQKPRNVIFMVMDGTNSDVVTLARWYKGRPLSLDSILVGGVQTYSLRSGITDSAAAATAMAVGKKTNEDMIGMIPFLDKNHGFVARPTVNILEAAKMKGLATGLISTSPIQHATPAAFSAHSASRNDYDDIAEQQVYQGINVVLGGGKIALLPKNPDLNQLPQQPIGIGSILPQYRKDGENLIQTIKQKGYHYIESKEQLKHISGTKVWGSFANEDIAYEIDRQKLAPNQPSLAEMTKKAIELLAKQKQGFFLFVEGSKIDWAAHKNDPIGMISEVLAFDAAVKEALRFAKNDKNTLLIAVTDHGNSGLTMGNDDTRHSYFKTPVQNFVNPLKKAKYSLAGAISQLNTEHTNIKQVAKSYGLDPLSKQDFIRLKKAKDIEEEMVTQLAKRAHLGFTTRGHTGEDVFLYAYGPSKPVGLINNTEIPKIIAEFLNVPSFNKLNHSLFVNANEYYKNLGYETKIDLTTKENPIFIAKKGETTITYPANKNIKVYNENVVELKGITIFNGSNFWISLD
ncbi:MULTISPECIES: alkaline phosphatase [Heyndrickxia]|uniref:alkaline phosphatase n=1 Tax=Heyndrickxia TaxID=2837504 RepID=UPI000D3AA500|nr:alkaline phosphatase [Heyndrickxia sporothermodurans]